jgi:hypothetical protein
MPLANFIAGIMMSNFTFIPIIPTLSGAIYDPEPTIRGKFESGATMTYTNQLLPTDPLGSMNLTLSNVVVGSAYDVEVLSTGQLVTSGSAGNTVFTLVIPVYASGDAKNSLRIKIRKGSSSPYYQPYETQVEAASGSTSIFVNQLSDES